MFLLFFVGGTVIYKWRRRKITIVNRTEACVRVEDSQYCRGKSEPDLSLGVHIASDRRTPLVIHILIGISRGGGAALGRSKFCRCRQTPSVYGREKRPAAAATATAATRGIFKGLKYAISPKLSHEKTLMWCRLQVN